MTAITDIVGYVVGTNTMIGNPTNFTGAAYINQPGFGGTVCWVNHNSSITTPGGTRPDGTTTQKLVEDSTNNVHSLTCWEGGAFGGAAQNSTQIFPNHIVFRVAFLVSAAGRTRFVGEVKLNGGGHNYLVTVGFDLAGKQSFDQTADTPWTVQATSVTDVGSGYLLCTFDALFNSLVSSDYNATFFYSTYMLLDNGSGLAARSTTYTGDGASGILVWWQSLMPKGAWLLTNQTFFDDFNDLSTIDVNDTRAPGFNWYVHNHWPNMQGHFGFDSATFAIPTPANALSVSGSKLTILNPALNPVSSNIDTIIMTGCASGDLDGYPTAYRAGFVWKAPAYIESSLGFDAAGAIAHQPLINNGTFAFWSLSLDMLTGATNAFGEDDFFEGSLSSPTSILIDTAYHNDFFKPDLSQIEAPNHITEIFGGSVNGDTGGIQRNPPYGFAAMAAMNRYARLTLSPAENDGLYGVKMWLFSGTYLSQNGTGLFAFSPFDGPQNEPSPFLQPNSTYALNNFSLLDKQYNLILFNANAGTVPGLTCLSITIDYVKVYQLPSVKPSSVAVHDSGSITRQTQSQGQLDPATGPFSGQRVFVDGVAGVNLANVLGNNFPIVSAAAPSGAGTLKVDASAQGTIAPKEAPSGTSTVTSVASSASSIQIIGVNNNRLYASIYNDSTQILYIAIGPPGIFTGGPLAPVTTSLYSVQIGPGKFYELPANAIQAVYGIWASANGFARITELSA